MSPRTATKKSVKSAAKPSKGFTAEEKAAMKDRVRELKAAAIKEQGESDALDRIAELRDERDRAIARRLHALIKANVPDVEIKTWYGFPAYCKNGKIVCFYQSKQKFNTRYSELGFNDPARLDDGTFWPVAYALTEMTPAVEAQISALVKKAFG